MLFPQVQCLLTFLSTFMIVFLVIGSQFLELFLVQVEQHCVQVMGFTACTCLSRGGRFLGGDQCQSLSTKPGFRNETVEIYCHSQEKLKICLFIRHRFGHSWFRTSATLVAVFHVYHPNELKNNNCIKRINGRWCSLIQKNSENVSKLVLKIVYPQVQTGSYQSSSVPQKASLLQL